MTSSVNLGVQPGEFRVCRLDGVIPRVVLVLGMMLSDVAAVCLLTNEVEYATSADVLVKAEESGFVCDVLVETDIIGTVYTRQLDDVVGRLSENFQSLASLAPNLSGHADRVGFPLQVPWDARRGWKKSELRNLHQLGSVRFSDVMD